MKRKQRVCSILVFVIVAIGFFTGCPNPSNTNNSSNVFKLAFDISGAKAIGATGGTSSRNARVADTQVGLVKILDDGTVKSALDLSGFSYVPRIRFVLKSPITNDLFVCFDSDLQTLPDNKGMQESYGSFIHLKSDGTAVSIVKNERNSLSQVANPMNGTFDENELLTFDSAGNLYFVESQNSSSTYTNVVKKYMIASGIVSQITPSVPNTYYESLAISADGKNLVVRAGRYNNSLPISYIRQIPIADADSFENLYYSSSGSYGMGYAVSKTDNSVYVSGYLGSNNGGLLKLYVEGDDVKQDSLFSDSWFNLIAWDENLDYPQGLFYRDSYDSNKRWSRYWKTDGVLDSKRVLDYISSQFVEPIIFTFEGKTNEEAIQAIDPTTFTDDNSIFLEYCKNESGIPAKTFEQFKKENNIQNSNLSFSNFTQLFHLTDDSLWGINGMGNQKKIVKLLDAFDKKNLTIPAAFRENNFNPMRFVSSGSKFVFSDAKYNGNIETGYHGLFLIDLIKPDMAPVNLLENVPNSNRFEIFDFSLAGNTMYFSAESGSLILCGKINIETKEYTQISTGQKITNLIVFN